jgi:hypothetical protein
MTVGIVMAVILALAMSFFAGHIKNNKNNKNEPAVQKSIASPAPVRKLSMTPDALQQALQVKLKFATTQLAVENGEFNEAFMLTMGEGMTMVGTVEKDGSIKGLALTLPAVNDGITPLMVLLSTAHAVTPDVPKEDINLTVTEMIKEATEGMEKGISIDRTVGSLQYSASADSTTGLRFSFAPN